VDISFLSVSMSDTALSMDGFPKLPCLVLQYDPPWEDVADGTHYHYMPIDALADAQLTFGVESDMEAVEFHVLNHAAEVEVMRGKSLGLRGMQNRQVDRGKAVRDLLDQVGNTLMAEVQAMELADPDTMMKSILAMSTEVGGGGMKSARALSAASPMANARRSARSLLLDDASAHSINRSAKGYRSLEGILTQNADLVENSRMRVLEAKYGHAIRKMIAVRHMEKERKKMTP